MDKNMTEVLSSLTETLRLCRGYENIHSIVPMEIMNEYGYIKEIAHVTYTSGHSVDIDIGCDSGIAAIYDVVRNLCY